MIGLFFGGQWFKTKFGNDFGNIELDAVLDERHEWAAEATSNPVETGAPVSDHIHELPDKLTIRGFVTDTPLTASVGLVKSVSRAQEVFDLLQQLIRTRELMSVYTQYRVYNDMALTNVTVPREAGVGEAIEFTAEFQHIRKVATQVVDVPKGISAKKEAKAGGANGSTARKAEPTKDGGKKQAVEKPSSTLARVFR